MTRECTYHLSAAPEIDPGALEILTGRQPGLDHSLAFEMLDRQLGLLSKASGVLNLYLGKALAPMLGGGYERMGYARAQDYCLERLGFCRRAAELLRKQVEQFDRHPAVRAAYLAARINESAARLILGHLDRDGGDPEGLIEIGASCTVRALRERLRESAGGDAGPSRELADAAGELAPAGGTWRTYHLPPAWIATWQMVVEHFRRTEEADLKPWQVLGLLAADFLAGRPVDLPVPLPATPPAGAAAAALPIVDTRWDRQRPDQPIDWRKLLEELTHCWKSLSASPKVVVEVDGRFGMPVPEDTRELDALLVELVVCRRRLDVYIGRMLRTMADYSLARRAQYASICHYAAERLGLGASTTSRLIGRDRGLIRRQEVYHAILAGRIGLTQADLILSLPDIAPDAQWIDWAETRTCRALEDAVQDILAAARIDRQAIRLRGWHPPGEGEILTAAQAPLSGARGAEGAEIPAPPAEAATSAVVAVQEAVKLLPMFSLAGEALRIFVPDDVAPILEGAQELASQIAGRLLPPEISLVALMIGAEASYSEFERKKVAQRRRLLRKSRYRCAVPGCRVRRGLHAHHVIYRSRGGGNEDQNLVILCPYHHLRGVHEGRLRIRRRGTDLVFEIGIHDGKPAMVFASERRIA
jgi:hypothetical protein